MISVEYDRPNCSLRVEGHAGLGKKGEDPLCAMVSILTDSAARIVAECAYNDRVKNPVIDFSEDGKAVISCVPTPKNRNGLMLQLDALCVGFLTLAAEFPDNITFTWNRHENA